MSAPRFGVTARLLVALLCACVLALSLGYVEIPLADVVRAAAGDGDAATVAIVREIRLPRVLLAAAVGAALGVSGATLQGLLRNALAEPGVIGVTASGGLGAAFALHFGLTSASVWLLPASAMAATALCTLVLLAVAARGSALTLILAGVALSSLATALTSLVINLSANPFALTELLFWLLGSLKDRSFDDLALMLPFACAGAALMLASGPALEALALGDETARSLGVDVRRTQALVVVGTALAVGASVAVAGAIGFVGLVVPHLLRRAVGHSPRALLVPSAVGGAVLLVVADAGVRFLGVNPELHLGVVTGLLGAPFFLMMVLRTSRGES
ncbi:MAG: iron ABC transporter permease [Alphaproteobacteria bacterium]|nr:iron ABC transporter permease [Alphaproteobacteria bacterium]